MLCIINLFAVLFNEAEANADLRGTLLLCRTDVNTKEIQDTILSKRHFKLVLYYSHFLFIIFLILFITVYFY